LRAHFSVSSAAGCGAVRKSSWGVGWPRRYQQTAFTSGVDVPSSRRYGLVLVYVLIVNLITVEDTNSRYHKSVIRLL
jgi:hypothetical protein